MLSFVRSKEGQEEATHTQPKVHISCLLDLSFGVEGIVEFEEGFDRFVGGGGLVEVVLVFVVRGGLASSLLVGLYHKAGKQKCQL